MKINGDYLLTDKENALIEEAIKFQFTGNICFKDYENKLVVEICPDKKVVNEQPIDKKRVESALEKANLDEIKARELFQYISKQIRDYCEINGLNKEDPVYKNLIEKYRLTEKAWGETLRRKKNIDGYLKEFNGRSIIPFRVIYGEFNSNPTPRVVIYLGSFDSDENPRYYKIVSTFIHEMFHAINYFKSGGGNTVREVEEPMVEFATGVFLEAISKTNHDFDIVSIDHKDSVSDKVFSLGEIVCYGFGRYLMDNVASKSVHKEIDWLETYSMRPNTINSSLTNVKKVVKYLYPFYPFKDENKVFNLFEIIIFGGSLKSSRKSPGPATRIKITRKDGSILQERTAAGTLVKAIAEAGVEDVFNIGILYGGFPLVSNTIHPKHNKEQVEVLPNVYILTHSNTKTKKGILDKISKELGLGWTVEIV